MAKEEHKKPTQTATVKHDPNFIIKEHVTDEEKRRIDEEKKKKFYEEFKPDFDLDEVPDLE